MKSQIYGFFSILGFTLVLLLGFQNCSDVKFQQALQTKGSDGTSVNPLDDPNNLIIPTAEGDYEPVQQSYTVPEIQTNKVDILFLVDTSGSMSSIQDQIGSRFSSFIQVMTSSNNIIDWQIAITSTNMQAINGPEGSRGQLVPLKSTSSGG